MNVDQMLKWFEVTAKDINLWSDEETNFVGSFSKLDIIDALQAELLRMQNVVRTMESDHIGEITKMKNELEESKKYADKLVESLPGDYLPKDIENIRTANMHMAQALNELEDKFRGYEPLIMKLVAVAKTYVPYIEQPTWIRVLDVAAPGERKAYLDTIIKEKLWEG